MCYNSLQKVTPAKKHVCFPSGCLIIRAIFTGKNMFPGDSVSYGNSQHGVIIKGVQKRVPAEKVCTHSSPYLGQNLLPHRNQLVSFSYKGPDLNMPSSMGQTSLFPKPETLKQKFIEFLQKLKHTNPKALLSTIPLPFHECHV